MLYRIMFIHTLSAAMTKQVLFLSVSVRVCVCVSVCEKSWKLLIRNFRNLL